MNTYSSAFKTSLWLSCIITACIWFINLGSDVLPGAYYIGGPGLTSHLATGSSLWFSNVFYSGVSISLILLLRLVIAVAEGLIIWLALYWLCRLLTGPWSPVSNQNTALPSLARRPESSQQPPPTK
jgi:hypothetical protein